MIRPLLALSSLLLLISSQAHADEFHHENLRYGQRALGMGGAVVATPGEPEMSFYNPAGLAFISGGVFSGAMHFFGLDRRTLHESSRAGDWFPPRDEVSEAFLALPSSSVITKDFADGDHIVALSTFLIDETRERFSDSITAPVEGNPSVREIEYQSARENNDRILNIGGSYAWRISEQLGVGMTIFYALREQTASTQRSEVFFKTTPSTGEDFETYTDANHHVSISDGALLFRLGALYQPSPSWAFGLGCSSESIRLHGSADVSWSLIYSGDPDAPERLPSNTQRSFGDLDATTVYPWSCRVGSRFASSILQLSADVSAYAPLSYRRVDIPSAESAAKSTLDNLMRADVEHEGVVNASVGVEVKLAQRWPLRAGFFTNFSAAPEIPDTPDQVMPPRVHLFGATLSAGYLGDDRSINLGAELQWGSGYDVVPRDLGSLLPERAATSDRFLRVERDHFKVVVFVSGAVSFAEKTAGDLFSDEE